MRFAPLLGLGSLACVALVAACAPARAPSPSAPAGPAAPVEEIEHEPEGAHHEIPPHAAIGEPKTMKTGAPASWWVWSDEGGLWHVRTTTASGAHRFRGRVRSSGGFVTDVQPLRDELATRVKEGRKGLNIDFHTNKEMDGFDFRVSDGGCVRFHLLIDGGPHPKRVFVGAGSLEPPKSHFQVCP